jgi:serine/threonine-protein kinase/endoribonuclease IRE1
MAVDVFSAGCMIFWVTSNGIHPFGNNPFNVVKGLYQSSAVSRNAEISDLVGWMVANRFEDRPSVDEALMHPFLWNHSTRMLYLTDVGNKTDQFKDVIENICLSCGSRNKNHSLIKLCVTNY